MVTSKKYTLSLIDLAKGLAVAVGTAAIDVAIEAVTKPPINWHNVAIAAGSAALLYLKVKFFTPSQKISKAE